MTPTALELTGIDKRFDRVTALHDAGILVRRGTVHALLGENGAGKTTLMRVAYGLLRPDRGVVRINGTALRLRSPADAIRAGLGMVQQHFTLVPAMTVLENVALGSTPRRAFRERVHRLARAAGLELDPAMRVSSLGVADQQRVEVLKALAHDATILILDEPTAALPPAIAEELFEWIRGFRDRGGSVVIITHKVREAFAIADDISVLRHGALSWTGRRDAATPERLVTAMLGSALEKGAGRARPQRDPAGQATPVASVDRLVVHDANGVERVREATLRVHAGEILGIAGVEGSGTRELIYALAGRLPATSGRLDIPREIGFIPEDRQHDALMLDESVADNVALRGAGARRGPLRRSTMESAATRLLRDDAIRAEGARAAVSTLSGGSQQRLVLARELAGSPALVVAMNPTRGLDVAATVEVQQRLIDAAALGAGVVYHTADLDELLEMSDRILAVFEGRPRDVAHDRETVGRAMLGAA